jgi:hypothetical protein
MVGQRVYLGAECYVGSVEIDVLPGSGELSDEVG